MADLTLPETRKIVGAAVPTVRSYTEPSYCRRGPPESPSADNFRGVHHDGAGAARNNEKPCTGGPPWPPRSGIPRTLF